MRESAILIALGGNAITREGEEGTVEQQFRNTEQTMRELVRGIRGRYKRVVLTHGNGPQVGNIVLRSELASSYIYPLPLDTCVSDSEGGMGYMFQQVLYNILHQQRLPERVVCVLTQVVVDRSDPAWQNPTKPIGRFYTEEEAKKMMAERGWNMREDAGRGWRRVVPSPQPREIIEISAVRALLEDDFIVIAAGGGGIPVIRDENGCLHGVEAVIDKDLASAMLAAELGIGTFVILTGVEKVAIDYRKPTQRYVDVLTVREAEEYMAQGQFPPGSMGPKIQAAINFLRGGGDVVIITSPEKFTEALAGETGTRIVKGE
jgi:carbamate kinase